MAGSNGNGRARKLTNAERVRAVRAELPAVEHIAYFNTGTNGPLPRRSHAAMVEQSERELTEGRIGSRAFEAISQGVGSARSALADLLGCATDEVALTHSTTEGINIALLGLDWRPGDELITSRLEHPGILYPALLLHQRCGVRLRMTEIGAPGTDSRELLRAALSPRTRAVALSHVSWSTGMVLPITELAALTQEAGALLICDAAQSAGMVPVDVRALGVDAYACSGQKWLCGPDATGALYVRKDRFGDIHQTVMGGHSVRHGAWDVEGNFLPNPTAARYMAITVQPSAACGLEASLRWLRDEVGWDWIYQRVAALGQRMYAALERVDDVTLVTPRDQMAGLVHFRVEGVEPKDVCAFLERRGMIARHTPDPLAVRVSTGFFNTEDEVDALAEAIAEASQQVNPAILGAQATLR